MTINWDLNLPLEGRQRREVFARFGFASYECQCVEKQLAILLSSACNARFRLANAREREDLWMEESSKTLGAMLRRLESRRVRLPDGIHGRLTRALQVRNRLAHNYFMERDRDILTTAGREEMISELADDADFLASVDEELTDLTEAWMIACGVATRSQLNDATRRYIEGDQTSG